MFSDQSVNVIGMIKKIYKQITNTMDVDTKYGTIKYLK